MPLLLPADIAAAPVATISGIALALLVALITLVETIVLRLLGWDTLLRCALVALVMNVVTTVIGAFLFLVPGGTLDASVGLGPVLLQLLIAWALSTAIEGGILLAYRRNARGQAFAVAAAANAVSYVGIFFVVALSR